MTNKIYIYLKGEEELGEIVEKIRRAKEKEIVLVVPLETKALLHPVNLEIFQKEIEKIGKKVYLDTEDEKLINLARHFRIPLFLIESEEKPIVDIRPPRKKEKQAKVKFEFKPKFRFNFSLFLKYLFSFLLVLGLTYFFWLIFQARAEVYIETEKTPIELNEVITLKEGIVNPDYENKILPAEYKKIELFKTETVTTTGKAFTQEKPLLKVVFLSYLDYDLPLVMGTRLAFGENIFRTTEKIVIPAAKNNEPGQKSTTAFIDILKDENLKILQGSDLKIVALEGRKTNDGKLWLDVLKAKVENDYDLTQMSPIGLVLPEDITKVKIDLEENLKSAVKTDLALNYPQSFYYFDPSLVKVEIQNVSHRVGEKTDKVSATGKAVFETMIASSKEFDDFVKNLINQKILNEKKNLQIKNFSYEKIELFDFDPRKKIMTLGVSAKALLIPDLNPEVLKDKIKGESLSSVQNYFSQLEGVRKIRIKIFPQWKENFPNDLKRIKIIIE